MVFDFVKPILRQWHRGLDLARPRTLPARATLKVSRKVRRAAFDLRVNGVVEASSLARGLVSEDYTSKFAAPKGVEERNPKGARPMVLIS